MLSPLPLPHFAPSALGDSLYGNELLTCWERTEVNTEKSPFTRLCSSALRRQHHLPGRAGCSWDCCARLRDWLMVLLPLRCSSGCLSLSLRLAHWGSFTTPRLRFGLMLRLFLRLLPGSPRGSFRRPLRRSFSSLHHHFACRFARLPSPLPARLAFPRRLAKLLLQPLVSGTALLQLLVQDLLQRCEILTVITVLVTVIPVNETGRRGRWPHYAVSGELFGDRECIAPVPVFAARKKLGLQLATGDVFTPPRRLQKIPFNPLTSKNLRHQLPFWRGGLD
mmetsp:Transcript_52635/g.112766  ORF Transcript_52635/g.112766 Transcript_52635/m.112766 type:complete len:279 (-) Transcript_52635:218-1054(-)